MDFEYRKVEAFEMGGVQFTLKSLWNGMEEWRDAKGRMVIVQRSRWVGLVGAFTDVFDSRPHQCRIIAGTPDLVAELKEAHAASEAAKSAEGQGQAEAANASPRPA